MRLRADGRALVELKTVWRDGTSHPLFDSIELAPPVLARTLEPFPRPVRTHDARHLASMEFLRTHGQVVKLASYDQRRIAAARALKIPVHAL